MPRRPEVQDAQDVSLDVDSDELKKFRKVVDKYYKTHLRHGGASGETGAATGSETGAETGSETGAATGSKTGAATGLENGSKSGATGVSTIMNSLARTNGPTAASGGTGSATGAASGLSGLTGPKLLVAKERLRRKGINVEGPTGSATGAQQ